jgi:hypothetical protein
VPLLSFDPGESLKTSRQEIQRLFQKPVVDLHGLLIDVKAAPENLLGLFHFFRTPSVHVPLPARRQLYSRAFCHIPFFLQLFFYDAEPQKDQSGRAENTNQVFYHHRKTGRLLTALLSESLYGLLQHTGSVHQWGAAGPNGSPKRPEKQRFPVETLFASKKPLPGKMIGVIISRWHLFASKEDTVARISIDSQRRI